MPTIIAAERPDTADAIALITELEAHLEPFYPPASRHGFSVDKLLRQGVDFFVIRQDGAPAGCGGVKLFGAEYGEVKRMYVRPSFRGLGLAKAMLGHLAVYMSGGVFSVFRPLVTIRKIHLVCFTKSALSERSLFCN